MLSLSIIKEKSGDILKNTNSLYEIIYKDILDKIVNGDYGNGEKLPTEQEFQDKYNVSRITTKKAMDKLCDEGYIIRYRGKGSFVNYQNNDATNNLMKNEVNIFENKNKNNINNNINSINSNMNGNKLFGLIVSDFSDSYGAKLLAGMEEVASKLGYFVVVKKTLGSQENESKAIKEFVDLNVAGIAILPVHGENYNSDIMKLVVSGFPMVVIDRKLKGLPVPFVGTDNVKAAKKAIDKLLKLGHKNIGIISAQFDGITASEDRIDGAKQSFEEKGLIFNRKYIFNTIECTKPGKKIKENISKDIENIKEFLIQNREITALLCIEYNIACLVKKAAEELNIKIPQDISIICFDAPKNIVDDYYFAHIEQEEREMGRIAMNILSKQLLSSSNENILLDANLIEGSTTKEIE